MEDVSRVTGDPVTVQWKGKDYILGGFSFEDWGLLQNELLRERRKLKMQVVTDLRDSLPTDIWREMLDKARQEAENIGEVSDAEVGKFLGDEEGLAFVLWVLFERRYPGAVRRLETIDMLVQGAINEDQLTNLLTAIQSAMGINQSGNSTGQRVRKTKARK